MTRRPFRPQVRSDQRPPAVSLEEQMLSGADAARDWSAEPEPLPPPPPMPAMPPRAARLSVAEVIEHYGGTRALARQVGLSQRQVERWAAGTADPSRARPRTREAFQHVHDAAVTERRRAVRRARKEIRDTQRGQRKETGQREWGALVERYGGPKALARTLGRHPRTVQRWVTGESHPTTSDQEHLRRLDRHHRLASTLTGGEGAAEGGADGAGATGPDSGAGPSGGPAAAGPAGAGGGAGGAPGRPPGRVYVYVHGQMKAQGYYNYDRQVGTQSEGPRGMHELPGDVADEFYGRMLDGDQQGALDALQAHLSTDYAQCGGYEADGDLGVHMQSIEEFRWELG